MQLSDYIKDCTEDEFMGNADEAFKDYKKLYDEQFYFSDLRTIIVVS